ncbi:hypothetical protein [Sphingobacterium sp. BIGb0165]|uniref:hypothetical protein n=1 Tax=Sphingobacterium sp. BIGb0165 TaxID=2940615 RepID=UPI002169EDDA|nr:hypothetical protein [Sphingobacterium sp. BIGb0165]MCS4226483.1 hypothetical protein [Sphingobacterium sp. BIGb0165]
MKRTQKHIPYKAPTVSMLVLEMEQGIAATSTGTVNPGDSTTPNQPKVEDWTDKGSQNKDFDL